ncbi:MAG: hypothetical protein E6474_03585 [Actinomyces sp.]|nr:hypothetical protein [Actinomyces sp.]
MGLAFMLSALLGYILLAYVARVLAPDEYAIFQACWGVIFGLASALAVVEQEISRHQANLSVDNKPPNSFPLQVGLVAFLALLILTSVLFVSGIFRGLFAEVGNLGTVGIFSAIFGFIPLFMVRGVLVGREKHKTYSVLLVLEPMLRLLVAGLVVLFAARESFVPLMIVAVASGSYAFLFLIRKFAKFVAFRSSEIKWNSVVKRVLLLGSSTGLSALLITGYPALVTALLGKTTGLGTFFTVVTASRIPLLLVGPIQAVAVPQVVRLIRCGKAKQLRNLIARCYVLILVCVVVMFLLAYVAGPAIVAILFGDQYRADGLMVAVVASASVMIAGTQLACACLVAFEDYARLCLAWVCGIALTSAFIYFMPFDGVMRAFWGLALGSVATCMLTGKFVYDHGRALSGAV